MEFLDNALEMTKIYFTTGVRWVFVVLAFYILLRQIMSLIQARNPSEIWAYLGCPDGTSVPLTHWENLIGRGKGCDVVINLNSVSRSHGTLIRDSAGIWRYEDLLSKNGSLVNDLPVNGPTIVNAGDILTIAGADFTLYPVSLKERMANIAKRKKRTKNVSPWPSMFALTLFQVLAVIQFKVALGEECPVQIIPAFALLCATMWAYLLVMKSFKRIGFEMEIIAFFLCTLSLAATTTAYGSSCLKQSICITIGVLLFFGLCWVLRDLGRVKKLVLILVAISVGLLFINLTMGQLKYGATNWVQIGGFTIQPSELVKIVFVFVGAGTLDELQKRKSMFIFMGFSVFCLGCLAIMGDFGTAIIFFVTYLVIAFLRSGDFSRLLLVVGAAGLMGMMILRFKPYIANRFAIWGHVWDDPTDAGYQQVQAMCSTASGGLPGLGAGNGTLGDVGAAPTDLVFCLISEEWGLIIAILMVVCIVTLGVFAVRSIIAGRSTYYSIAACGAMTMFMFQTILNVFGTVDLLPLTGVTFPFVSAGGTSMIASWGMLAFLKAADTRQNASFAVSLDKRGDFESELEGANLHDPEEIINEVGVGAGGYTAKDYDRLSELGAGGGAASAAARLSAAASHARKSRASKPAANQYTYDAKKATMVQPSNSSAPDDGHFTNKNKIKYQDLTDEDFFRNLDDIRPATDNSFEARYERVAPKSEPKKSAAKTSTKKPATAPSNQSGSQRRTPVPQRKPAGRTKEQQAKAAQLSREEQLRRQHAHEEYQKRKALDKARREEESPLTLEDIFGDDHR